MKKNRSILLICMALTLLAGCSETAQKPNSQSSVSESSKYSANSENSVNSDSEPVADNKNITVSASEPLVISDSITCESGSEIRIEKGGVLKLDSEMELLGDIYVEGRLEIGENAKISGSGVIHVVNSFDDIDCKGTVTAKIDAPEPVEIDGVTYVGGILVVNKKFGLPKDYEKYGKKASPDLYAAMDEMREASGFTMHITSDYRSYATQEWWHNYWISVDGEEVANTYSAIPGHSEHQTGLAADITRSELDYADTEEGKWLAANCYKYGLILRYPEDKVDITGYIYEPWHVRYLGKSTAKLVHDSGLCLEEFLEID